MANQTKLVMSYDGEEYNNVSSSDFFLVADINTESAQDAFNTLFDALDGKMTVVNKAGQQIHIERVAVVLVSDRLFMVTIKKTAKGKALKQKTVDYNTALNMVSKSFEMLGNREETSAFLQANKFMDDIQEGAKAIENAKNGHVMVFQQAS